MTPDRGLALFRHTTLLCAALAFSLGSASAQIATPPDSSNSLTSPSAESSSNALQLADDAGAPVPACRMQLQRRGRPGQAAPAAGNTITGLMGAGVAGS